MRSGLSRLPGLLMLLTVTAFASNEVRATEHIVRIVTDYKNLHMAFEPDFLRIEPGDYVTWFNEGDEEHDVITFPDGYPKGAQAFRSPIMTRTGERFSHRFDVPGTYDYHCMPHLPMGMQGSIVVGRPSSEDEFHDPSPIEIEAYKARALEWFDEFIPMDREERAQAAMQGPESALESAAPR